MNFKKWNITGSNLKLVLNTLTITEFKNLSLLDRHCLLKNLTIEERNHINYTSTMLVGYSIDNECIFCKTIKEEKI